MTPHAEQLLAGILRGERVGWPSDAGEPQQDQFLEAAARHGVTPLVAHQLHRTNMLWSWPERVRERLRQATREDVLIEEIRRGELLRVLSTMATVNIRPLLMKGAGVAYLYYPSPFLRPRDDVDLLIRRDDLAMVAGLMRDLGYRRSVLIEGDLIMPQCRFHKQDDAGVWHTYDVHWKIATPQVFADALDFDELMSRSIELPALGADARTLGSVDALLLACVHRVAHHADSGRLLWLYDIHLMAERMDRETFGCFVALAAQKRVANVCASSLRLVQRRFQTKLPSDLMDASLGAAEASAAYVGGQMRTVDVLMSDLLVVGGWRARWQLVREHLFPPPSFMLQRYATSNRLLLPALYAHRLARGAPKWFRRRRSEKG